MPSDFFNSLTHGASAVNYSCYSGHRLCVSMETRMCSLKDSNAFFTIFIKPCANGRNIVPTLQHCWPKTPHIIGCCMLRPFAHTLLHVVGICATKFETDQSNICFVPLSQKRSATTWDTFAQLFQHRVPGATQVHYIWSPWR